MKYTLLLLLGSSATFLLGKNHHVDRNLEMMTGGYDKHPKTNFETTNGTSPAPRTFGSILCAENFGNCCNTSFCCESSPTGCCVKGTQCTPNGCVGDPAFLIQSVTTTTTLTSVVYYTSTAHVTSVSTNLDVTTKFLTSTVTRNNIDLATVTNYVTSTKIAKRFLPENPKRIDHTTERRSRQTPPTLPLSPTTARGIGAFRHGLEHIGVLPKRDVTSYVYDFVFVWDTYSSGIVETSTVTSEIDSISTEFSTIVSTLFQDAKSTTTVVSTVVVTSTQVPTTTITESYAEHSLTELVTKKTSNDIVVMTTFVVGVTNSGNNEATTATNIIDGGGASGLQAATGISTATSGGDDLSSVSNAAIPTSSSIEPNSQNKQGDLSIGAKAGIGAGAGAAGLALLSAIIFFALGKRRRPTSTISGDNSQAPMAPSTVSNWTPPPPPLRYSHLDGREISYTERAAALARSMESMHQPTSIPNARSYQQSSNFTPTNRRASPSTPSEFMMRYESPREDRQEMGGTAENMGWHMEPNTVPHEMADANKQYYEMPSSPIQPPRNGHAW
ncbi:hypothetical protein GQX73_g2081 [Xylaria multiplex]|uniref:Mid2 domain-containing protein n=1 Tax=Xylaria multiplex TaxID=323545 RepID=A0A7C8IUP0_9PEZI|nr:hypothetical protein GQX73_g2081 [Xylaria multiplex]